MATQYEMSSCKYTSAVQSDLSAFSDQPATKSGAAQTNAADFVERSPSPLDVELKLVSKSSAFSGSPFASKNLWEGRRCFGF